MSVIPLTLTVSLCLVFTFVLFFLKEHTRRSYHSPESDALLPLAEETAKVVATPAPRTRSAPGRKHAHEGAQPCRGDHSCAGCVRRRLAKNGAVAAKPGSAEVTSACGA